MGMTAKQVVGSDGQKILRALVKAGPSSCMWVCRSGKTAPLFIAGQRLVAEGLARVTQCSGTANRPNERWCLMLTDAGACTLALSGAR